MVRDVLTRTVLVGFVVPGVEVGVFDAAGDRCGPERIGFIRLRRTADAAAGGSRAGYRRVSPTGLRLDRDARRRSDRVHAS